MEMTRRHMFAAASAAAAMTFPHTALGGWEPSERYPDPAIKSLDPSFNRYRLFNASIERLATGMRWCEGPVYFGDARCLIWSDIPNNRLMLRRGHRRGQHLSRTLQPRQRQSP
jgi:gluconolactonase